MAVMTNIELVNKLKNIANNYKTLYVMGCFGAPLTPANKTKYSNNHAYNRQSARKKMIQNASADTFGFDCVNLIKAVLWGWNGDVSKPYGGAAYGTNGVPDINADTMITKCSGISTDFSDIAIGEAVWMKGHIGVYIGSGLAVECTPKWGNCVQITSCNCYISGYNRRNWTKHGKLPYVEYTGSVTTPVTSDGTYYGKYTGGTATLDAILRSIGVPYGYTGNWAKRIPIAQANGISNYTGTAAQNTTLINLAKAGKLRKVGSSSVATAPATPSASYYAKYTGSATTLDAILRAIGVPSAYVGNWAKRAPLAKANGISNYVGSASQNTTLINLAKSGKLKKV